MDHGAAMSRSRTRGRLRFRHSRPYPQRCSDKTTITAAMVAFRSRRVLASVRWARRNSTRADDRVEYTGGDARVSARFQLLLVVRAHRRPVERLGEVGGVRLLRVAPVGLPAAIGKERD